MTTTIDFRSAASRFNTKTSWLNSHHSFSFGKHFDAANTGHGLLVVLNDDVVAPGGGFATHSHRDMEIVTWVLEGELEHKDSENNFGVIYPGLAQRMSAGAGITHSEMNHSAEDPVRFIQMWVPPAAPGLAPGYEQCDLNDRLEGGGLIAVASGQGHDGAVSINQPGAVLWIGHLKPGTTVTLPDAQWVHLYIARGSGQLGGTQMVSGDAARLTNAGRQDFDSTTQTEIIVWETKPTVGAAQ